MAVSVGLAAGGVLIATEASQAASNFDATATADIMRSRGTFQPGILADEFADPGASTTQATLDSLGDSKAFAANPFPGTLVVSLPATLAGSVAKRSAPDYPLIAQSSYPSAPEGSAGAGAIQLNATSGATSSKATATDGTNHSTVETTSDPKSDVVRAYAEATLSSVAVNDLFVLDGIRSTATVVRAPGEEPQRSAELSVARMMVLGQTFVVRPDGVELLSQKVPTGGDAQKTLQPLLDQLAAQGVSLSFAAPVNTPTGIVSGAVEIMYKTTIPNVGVSTTILTFGRTYASVSNTAGESGLQAGTSAGDVLAAVGAGGSVRSAPASGGSSGSLGNGGVSAPTGSSNASAVATTFGRSATADIADKTPVSRLYPVLLVAAAAAAIMSSLFRQFGVRLVWTS